MQEQITERQRPQRGDRHQRRGIFADYSPEQPMPLGGYLALLATWTAGAVAFIGTRRHELPRRIAWGDFALLAIATHKLSRIVTKDWVTSPLRAPFVRYERSTGGGEVEERPRGQGLRRAIGDLLTCKWCIAPWVAGGLAAGLVVQPRITRFVALIFGAVAVSDALQFVYDAEKRWSRS